MFIWIAHSFRVDDRASNFLYKTTWQLGKKITHIQNLASEPHVKELENSGTKSFAIQ